MSTASSSRPPLFGRLVVQLGLASQEQVDQSLAELSQTQASGAEMGASLGHLMISKGLLTAQQVQQILRMQKKELLVCAQCGARMNVCGYRPGAAYHCRICTGILVRPKQLTDVSAAIDIESSVDPSQPGPLPDNIATPRTAAARQIVATERSHATGTDTEARLAREASEGADSGHKLVGRTLRNYKVLGVLGVGGMATVYLAENTLIKRKVALKVLHPELARNETYVRRFFREARLTAQLSHPNIVAVWDVAEADGLDFLVMEYVSGKSMKQDLLDRGHAYTPDEAIYWHLQVLDGLAHAHDAGIIHRDLKPDNYLIDRNKVLKIADFGIARIDLSDGESPSAALTRPDQRIGTPHYMAPELLDTGVASKSSDLYAVGVSLYLAMTGQFPYPAESVLQLTLKLATDKPHPLNKLVPDVSAAVNAAVMNALAQDPGKRFASATEMRDALTA